MKNDSKYRLDDILVSRGIAANRSKAKAIIMSGIVFKGNSRLDKPGQRISADTNITIRGRSHPWVSRGGIKLAHGLDYFGVAINGCVCIDIGASTGGFTDVLLSRGAKRVYAVDSGYGQLDWGLRKDPRVIVLERINARYLTSVHVPEPVSVVTCDTSFISLTKVLPAPLELAVNGSTLLALIKPQFEAGRNQVGKGGVVRDPNVHKQVCQKIEDWLDNQTNWHVIGIEQSPIQGPSGNSEFLLMAKLSH